MAICLEHKVMYNVEINETCYKCKEKQELCVHKNKGPDRLFDSRVYFGLSGEWDKCYDCGKMIEYKC